MTNKARELLERALEELIFQNAALRWDEPKVIAEIRAYLAEPEVKRDDEPIGYVYSEYGSPRKNVALSNDSIPNGTPVYLHPAPRKPFVRLNDEEIVSWWGIATEAGLIEFARAIEDALEAKNA